MMNYAMVSRNKVIEVLKNQNVEPHWPPERGEFPIIAVPCDVSVERGMEYDPLTGKFFEPHVNTEPTQLDRIESMVAKSHEQIAQEARDAYTLELINSGII